MSLEVKIVNDFKTQKGISHRLIRVHGKSEKKLTDDEKKKKYDYWREESEYVEHYRDIEDISEHIAKCRIDCVMAGNLGAVLDGIDTLLYAISEEGTKDAYSPEHLLSLMERKITAYEHNIIIMIISINNRPDVKAVHGVYEFDHNVLGEEPRYDADSEAWDEWNDSVAEAQEKCSDEVGEQIKKFDHEPWGTNKIDFTAPTYEFELHKVDMLEKLFARRGLSREMCCYILAFVIN